LVSLKDEVEVALDAISFGGCHGQRAINPDEKVPNIASDGGFGWLCDHDTLSRRSSF
jgi:hypothetical protein